MESKEPEACAEEEARNDEDPDGCGGTRGDSAVLVGVVRRHPGSDRIGDVVAAMRDGHDHGAQHLGVGPEMLHLVIVAFRAFVGCVQSGGVMGDAVAGDALKEEELDVAEETFRVEDREMGDGG